MLLCDPEPNYDEKERRCHGRSGNAPAPADIVLADGRKASGVGMGTGWWMWMMLMLMTMVSMEVVGWSSGWRPPRRAIRTTPHLLLHRRRISLHA